MPTAARWRNKIKRGITDLVDARAYGDSVTRVEKIADCVDNYLSITLHPTVLATAVLPY